MKLLFISLLFALAELAFANVSEQNVNPGINQHYVGATYQEWVKIFERDEREVYNQRHTVMKALKLRPSSDVADIGAGTGFYSLLFAKAVGATGNVFAVDITEDFILNINRRAREQNLKNIHAVLSSQKDTLLAPQSIDLAFVCATFHHFEYPKSILASIHRALRPGGKLVIIDFRKQVGLSSEWVMSHVRLDKKTVIKEIEQTGFKFESELNILKSNYFLWFVKKK
jgi:ubiquinone/menaquinone biosynthesis C-methylase UbiE